MNVTGVKTVALPISWTGYHLDCSEEERYVYVTEHGEVWHSNVACTYLTRNVQFIKFEIINKMRNVNGGKYYPCKFCRDNIIGDHVYVTSSGNRYHLISTCSSLTRNIIKIIWEERNAYRPCTKCSQL